LRVVAGELKGRRLASPPRGAAVRPTSDRAREALFSILGDVTELTVLDLFCGTGALAIEALSRGARRATLVDSDPELARRNVDALGLADRVDLVRSDVGAFLRTPGARVNLILCDPPYRLAARLEADLGQLLPSRLAPGGRLVVESAAREPHALELDLELERERRYGASRLRIWRKA
jgi:16S rRNA (guanine966-N2)-methyltransferase